MNVVITRMDAWTAAGRGVERLLDAVCVGRPLQRELGGFPAPIAALPEEVDVTTLLREVVAGVLPTAGAGRVGLVVGTTSGAISGGFEAWMRRGAKPAEELRWRSAPALAVAGALGLAPVTTVSVACASSTLAFEIGAAWIRGGRCDRVIVAGVDKHSLYIHAGFAGLGALGPTGSRPFSVDRDGLLLGEGAAAFLLEPAACALSAPLAALLGAATSQDAYHLTAPRPDGAGLARAIQRALAIAALDSSEIDAVSAHGTGTVLNDAAEAQALITAFGGAVPLHAIKGVVGHCLGAAGAVEAAVVIAALNGAPLPAPPVTALLATRQPGEVRHAISVSAAFGGLNAAVVFGRVGAGHSPAAPGREAVGGVPLPEASTPRSTELSRFRARKLPLSTVWPGAPAALGRADRYVRAGVRLCRDVAPHLQFDDLIVLRSARDCRSADLRYFSGVLARGFAGSSRLHFPYTVPGAPLAEGSIAAGLRHAAWVLCDADDAAVDPAALLRGAGYRRVVLLRVDAASDDPARFAIASATLYE
ncbi:hypothetical protein LBMAG42_19530 [Deltaproteobacteria bacterium]|nr:hypothetical protein LBMAG42_19530 [Deltaproteobacteria bacterium]